jgi:hypothetical protein
MSWISRRSAWGAALLALGVPSLAAAQGWRETQLFSALVASKPATLLGGVGLAWRDQGRTRIGGALAAGTTAQGGWAGRAEVAWHFLLDPGRRQGGGLYGGGGAALTVRSGGRVRPWVQLVLGFESAPAGPNGVFVEAGVGGGVRIAAGVRLRKQNAPGR